MTDKDILKYQMITSIVFIGTVIISIALTYNERQNILNKDKLFADEEADKIAVINRSIVLILFIIYLYLNYQDLKDCESKGKDTYTAKLQLIPSLLSIIAAIIILYIVIYNEKRNILNISSVENPTI